MKKLFNLYTLTVLLGTLLISNGAISKASVDPYVGEWHYTFPSMDGGEVKAVMTIKAIEGGYSGFLSSEMGTVDMENLVIEDGKLTAKLDIQGMTIDMKGTFDGDKYNGTTNFDGNEFPMNATKKQAED